MTLSGLARLLAGGDRDRVALRDRYGAGSVKRRGATNGGAAVRGEDEIRLVGLQPKALPTTLTTRSAMSRYSSR
jgi:hypothetical protein